MLLGLLISTVFCGLYVICPLGPPYAVYYTTLLCGLNINCSELLMLIVPSKYTLLQFFLGKDTGHVRKFY
jgi:hypothetical protein